MKNTFHGLIRRLDMAEERVSELGDMRIETSKTEKQKETGKISKQNRMEYPGTVNGCKRYNICAMVIPEGEERKKRRKAMFEAVITENVPSN